MNNCGSSAWLVPTSVELNTRDLDVRDVTATNGSFKTLSVNGEAVTVNSNMSNTSTSTTFKGDLTCTGEGSFKTLTVDGKSPALNPNMTFTTNSTTFEGDVGCTGSMSAETLVVNARTVFTECYVETMSYPYNTDGTIVVQSNMSLPDSNTTLNAYNIQSTNASINSLTATSVANVGYTETGTNLIVTTLNSTVTNIFLTGPSIGAGTWLITFRVEFFVTSCTTSNSIYLRLYEGDTNTQTFYEIIPPATSIPVSMQGSVVTKSTTTKSIKLGGRLYASGPTISANSGMLQVTRIA